MGLKNALTRFAADEAGSPTLEFVLVVPFFLLLFFWIIETGFMTFTAIQLDRGVDIVVRNLMLSDILQGRQGEEAHTFLKQQICNESIVTGCLENIKLEVGSSTTSTGGLGSSFECLDRAAAEIDPLYEEVYRIDSSTCDAGDPDIKPEIMFFRACLVIDPILPSAFAMPWTIDASGGVQLRSSSAFVNEPC